MERLLTTGAVSQRRVDSKQATMAYLVSVSCEPAGGLYPSASYRFFLRKKVGHMSDELEHVAAVSVFDCNRLGPLPDEWRSFRFHLGPSVFV